MISELVTSHDREIVGPPKLSEAEVKGILMRLTTKHGVRLGNQEWHQSAKTSVLRYHIDGNEADIEKLIVDLRQELCPLECSEGVG